MTSNEIKIIFGKEKQKNKTTTIIKHEEGKMRTDKKYVCTSKCWAKKLKQKNRKGIGQKLSAAYHQNTLTPSVPYRWRRWRHSA